MIRQLTFRRTLFFALVTLLAVGATTILLPPQTEAVGCTGNTHSPVEREWVLTPEALERTESGFDCTSAARPICREECIVACGENIPQGKFACFAN
ncbi:MAG: hypothetical protein AAF657_03145 [Acidobacteriota bacterium]